MSEIPAKATEPEGPSGDARAEGPSGGTTAGRPPGAAERDGVADVPVDETWQSSPPGSIYDYIKVASFSIGPDGLVDQWSERAERLFGVAARDAVGKDPIEAFVAPELRTDGHRKMAEILDGREWTGVVPFRVPDERRPDGIGLEGIAEVYVMPTETEDGEKAAVCIVVDIRALRQIETDLAASQAIFGQSPFGFLLFGTDLKVQRANRRFADVFGGGTDDHRGHTVHDYLPRHEADRMAAALKRVLETGESVTDMQIVGPAPGSSDRRHWSINLYRVHSGAGRPIGVAGLGTDVTMRHAAAREAAHARRNLALLNEAGARIGNSLDLETTARELLDVTVPGFCDLASVDLYQGLLDGDEAPPGLVDGSAELRRVAFASAVADAPFPDGSAPLDVGVVHRFAFTSPCADALRAARPRLVTAEDDESASRLTGGLVQSTLAVPMVAHDTVVGLAQFSRTKGSEPFGERDRALAVELAARAAVCIDNARLYRREHERALILQRSLLPPGDPEASGLDIACRYLPGNAATEVGGDWFDVIELPGHRTALVIGDVMGRGLRAAVAMGELRTAVRTLALLDTEPAEVLSALDEIARGLGNPAGPQRSTRTARKSADADLGEVYLATCVYAVYDAVTRRCTFANAGHLPPVLVEPGEPGEPGQRALMLDVPPGMPLGVGGEPFEDVEVELPEGALLALYTDGLVESRDHPLDEGLNALVRSLGDAPPARPWTPTTARTTSRCLWRASRGCPPSTSATGRCRATPSQSAAPANSPATSCGTGTSNGSATRRSSSSASSSPTPCATARARSASASSSTARWSARCGTAASSSHGAAVPATRTRAAAASSSSASSARPGAPAERPAAKQSGSNSPSPTAKQNQWTRRRLCSACSEHRRGGGRARRCGCLGRY